MAGIARWCFRHRYLVLTIWVAALMGLAVAQRGAGTGYSDDFALPGTESTHALQLLHSAFPDQAGDDATVVWHTDTGQVTDPSVAQPVGAMLDTLAHAPSVTAVSSPYEAPDGAGISQDGHTAYATVTFRDNDNNLPNADVENVIHLAQSARSADLQVELGGGPIGQVNQVPMSSSEIIGIVAAAVVLLLAFGSLLAMLLPLATAVLGLIGGTLVIGLISNGVDIPTIAPTVGALIGLGVGIDYALFVVTRHRSGIRAGLSPQEAAVRALNTSGRAVIFAGLTVCAAMLGLLVLHLSFLSGIGIAAAVMVLFSVAAAVTLLPALLGVLGHRVLSRRERRALAEHGPVEVHTFGFWARWSELIRRRPGRLAPVALAVMAALIIPMFAMHLGTADQGNDPSGSTTRKAYDLLADGFGPGFNGPLQLVAQLPGPGDAQALNNLVDAVRATPDVAAVAPVPTPSDSTIAVVQVIPDSAPQDQATSKLITTLREHTVPAAEKGTTMRAYVGGGTAIDDDFAAVLAGKLPLFVGVIVAMGFLLLAVAFRSLLVPLTAAVMNLLAACASLGLVVAFFQWGWGSQALGLGSAGPVEAFLPVMLLAILFGLSMDYQVFLVSRMHEEWVHTKDNRHSVAIGQACTGRVITAAATIMICVFMAFVFGGQRIIAEFGVGLAGAVFLDAFVLRTVLVPAVMHLLGRANWWLPRFIDRRLPHLSVEPVSAPPAATPVAQPALPAAAEPVGAA